MKKFLKYFAVLILLVCLGGVGVIYYMYHWASQDLPNFTRITDYAPALVTTVHDRDGGVLGYFYKERRWLVKLDEMNKWLPLAFLASEDNSFYDHEGVDLMAIFRAFIINLQAGGIKQGGSTITQQIVKQLLLTNERSYERKIKEAILAYRLEKYLTKEEILIIYLNQIFLGAHSYGVEAACRSYFGKHSSEVTLAEAAMIAGLPQAPSRYNPYDNFKSAKDRQRYVLGQMRNLGWITPEQEREALDEEIVLKSMPDPSWGKGAYYLEEVRRWLIDKYGEDTVYTKGLSVYTACDPKHQAIAEQALKDGLVASAKRRGQLQHVLDVSSEVPVPLQSILEQVFGHHHVGHGLVEPALLISVNRIGNELLHILAEHISLACLHDEVLGLSVVRQQVDAVEVPLLKDRSGSGGYERVSTEHALNQRQLAQLRLCESCEACPYLLPDLG
ncbi:MAG: transglycosylase domain-containing protein, partial [Proteobacteria bacterium]|nr:transglycosylase domain-containing protein [Pseudomonadota bacterium]